MRHKTGQQLPRLFDVAGVYPQPGVHERADQPGPEGSLMIGGVARSEIAVVIRFVVGMPWGETPQAERRQESRGDLIENRLPPRGRKDRTIEGDGENLVRTE